MTIRRLITIEIDNKFVEDVTVRVYSEVTKQLSGIDVTTYTRKSRHVESPVSTVILSKGIFKSKVICVFPSKFIYEVTKAMNDGEELSEDDRRVYFKEYLNICFGRIISVINNELGHASRFVIPVMLDGVYHETGPEEYTHTLNLELTSFCGDMRIGISFDVLPEHSSN